MTVRALLKANIGVISPKKIVKSKDDLSEYRVISVWLGENSYNSNGKAKETVWYLVSYWNADADKFEEKGFGVGDYVETELFSIRPQTFEAKDGQVHKNIVGTGGHVYLIKKKDQDESDIQNMPPSHEAPCLPEDATECDNP